MRMLTLSAVLAGLCFAATCGTAAHAAEDRLTKDQLYTMLENMGYTVEKKASGADYDLILKTRNADLNLSFSLSFSGDGSKIWFMQNLLTITDENASRVPWQKILAANNARTGACMFEYYEKGRALYLDATLDNRAVKPSDLRAAVEQLSEAVVKTRDLWDEKNWPASNTVGQIAR